MLVEPDEDPERQALDRTVVNAVSRRIAAGPRSTPDADTIAERNLTCALDPREAEIVRSVLGRVNAAHGARLVVWGPASPVLAADRFGLGATLVADPSQALAAVRNGSRALMDLTGSDCWWGRLLAEPGLRIVAALPDDRCGVPRALMVQRARPGPTGEDRTFWVTDSRAPDARIVETLGTVGLAANPLIAAGGLKLFMLAGYVQADEGRLNDAPGKMSGVIGAAPLF